MYPKAIYNLIQSLKKLPGIGEKTAERLALHLATQGNTDDLIVFSDSIKDLIDGVKFCKECNLITDNERCDICNNSLRDNNQIMIVSDSKDVFAMERTSSYLGKYHVLGGLIDFSRGITEKDLTTDLLLGRVNKDIEIIIATSSTVEGELTAQYIKTILTAQVKEITRLAYGLPVGTDLKYADEKTLSQAIINRLKF